MRIDARRGRCGLGLTALVGLVSVACAPPCYDDGALQGGGNCPEEGETDAASSSASASSSGRTVTAEGTAEGGVMTASGSGTPTADGSSGGPQCPGFDALLSAETRTFEFVVEQSGSMGSDFDGVSRYDALAEALVDPADGVVAQQQAQTRFGMLLYRGLQAGCPITESVVPEVNTAAAIGGLMAMNLPSGSNPVPDAINEASAVLTADPAEGSKTLVLVMSSEPGSCEIQSPANVAELAITRSDTIDAVEAAFDMGYPTAVIAVDRDIDAGFLQLVANAGIGQQAGDPDAPLWVVEDREQLSAAAAEITAFSRGCVFPLADPISNELAPACEVVVNGGVVMYQDADGWNLPDEQTLELQGAACNSIQQGLATISMTCACDA